MPTLAPCPAMLAATSEAARLACPSAPLSVQSSPPKPGRCIFRQILRHGRDVERDGAAARERLCELERRGAMVRDDTPQLLIYRHACGGHRTVGLVGACPTGELGLPGMSAPIAIPERADESTASESSYLESVGAHLEPATVAIPHCGDLERLLRDDTNERPRMHFVGPDRATHTIWRVHDPTALLECVARATSATVINNAQAACAAMRVPQTVGADAGSATDESARFLVMLVIEQTVGRCGLELCVDPAHSPDLDRESIARALGATLNGVPQQSEPPRRTATVHEPAADTDPVVIHLPDHDRAHDLLHVEASLREAGIRFTIGPASGDRPTTPADAPPTIRLRLHALSINDLHRTLEHAASPTDGLPPRSCWLPPVPLCGLVVHPFR